MRLIEKNLAGIASALICGAVLAMAGCHAAQLPAGPAGGFSAPDSAGQTGTTQVADGGAQAGPPVTEVEVPADFPFQVSASRIQVVEGDLAASGSLSGNGGVPINDALVYLTSPDDRYYVARAGKDDARGILVAVRTDADGDFATPGLFAKGTPFVANALLARNRRLVGLGVAGETPAKTTIGSTFAFEYFRETARQRGVDPAPLLADAATRSIILAEAERAQDIVQDASRAAADLDADLTMGNGAILAARYVSRVLAFNVQAYQAWRSVGLKVNALTTMAGTFQESDNEPASPVSALSVGLHAPAAVTQGPPGDDAVYVAERDGWHVKRIDVADGELTVSAGRIGGRDPTVFGATISADATLLSAPEVFLPFVYGVAADAKGNLALTFKNRDVVAFVCRIPGTYFNRGMTENTMYYLTAPDGLSGLAEEGPDDQGVPRARFRDPAGMTFDADGNLYVCDRRNNLIRKIDAGSGAAEVVLGDGWPYLSRLQQEMQPGDGFPQFSLPLKPEEAGSSDTGAEAIDVTDYGRLLDGTGLAASFNRPLQVQWRRAGDKQELYIYDSYNSVIRKATTAYPGSFKDAAVEVFAGQAQLFETSDRTYKVSIGKAGPPSEGFRTAVTFDLASYDPTDQNGAQVVPGGLALDSEHDRLYVADTNNRAIRAIDLGSGQVSTLARHDPAFIDGDATRALLSGTLGGMTVLRGGDLVFCDLANHVVRRIHLRHDFAD